MTHKRSQNRLFSRAAAIGVFVLAFAGIAPLAAQAADPVSNYGAWSTPGDASLNVTMPPGFPATTVTTNSSAAQTASGASMWQGPGTDFGSRFGTSRGSSYSSLRPISNSPSPEAASTTTYSFATATPANGWGFSLGDIDAEILTVTATDTSGAAVSAAGLGFQGAYNYCDVSPKPQGCGTLLGEVTVVSDATSYTFSDESCVSAPASPLCDSDGNAVWFAPTVGLSTLTVTSQQVSGAPTYQTWFAVDTEISGVLTQDCPPATTPQLMQLWQDGELVTSTPIAADGSYAFRPIAAAEGYSVLPAGLRGNETLSGDTGSLDLSSGSVVNTALSLSSTFPVTGTVSGDLITDVAVSLTVNGTVTSTTTTSEGTFSFDDPATGTTGTLSFTAPAGHTITPQSVPVSLDCAPAAVTATTAIIDPVEGEVDATAASDAAADTEGSNDGSNAGSSTDSDATATATGTGAQGDTDTQGVALPGPGGLPATGANGVPMLLGIAGILLVAGVVLLVAKRRRRR